MNTGPFKVKKLTSRRSAVALILGAALSTLGAAPPSSTTGWDFETTFLFSRPEFTWGRSPFEPKPGFAPSTEKEPGYELTAVLFDGENSEAIINGARVRRGDEIGWRIVEEIGQNYVLLSYGSESVIELNVPQSRGAASSIQLEEVSSRP